MTRNDKWIGVDDAAKYLGLGKTSFYKLAREGKVPGKKVQSKWVFNIEELDQWLEAEVPIEEFFSKVKYDIENNSLLREPQREGYQSAYDFFKKGKKEAIIQIPVGCGKSGLAAILPFGISEGRVLIISPNLTIKDGLSETLDVTNRQKCFWRKFQVLSDKDLQHGPYSCTLDIGNLSICEKSHITLTNIHQLSTNVDKWLTKFPDGFFDLIIVDEAHHSPADSWQTVFNKFNEAKIIYLTATPFRSDRKKLSGELIYRYPFNSACLKGYIKRLKAIYVAPSEVTMSFQALKGISKTYSLEEVLKMKEKDWFSRGIALSEICNRSIVDNSLSKLEELRQTGTRHQLIAVACSVDHARQIRSLYSERGYNAEIIYSEMKKEEQDAVKLNLYNGTLDCIIQVQMLGEGFDHPKLSVAAIFRPFRTLAPYIQFVGRIMRVIVQNNPTHPDNYGYIVTHLGMNLDQRLKEFQEFENDDQVFWEKVIGGEEPPKPKDLEDGLEASNQSNRRNFNTPIIQGEIVDKLFVEDLITIEDKEMIKELAQRLSDLGLDPSDAEKIVRKNKENETQAETETTSAEPFSILPQKRWAELKRRLSEKVNSQAKVVLNNVNLEMSKNELTYKYKFAPATSNLVSVITMINQKIKDKMSGRDRNDWTIEEFETIIGDLDNIRFGIEEKIKRAIENEQNV